MNTVWIVHSRPGRSYEGAKSFGKLRELLPRNISVFNPNSLAATIGPIIADFKEDDYLLISGHAIACSLTVYLLSLRHRKINVLYFEARDGEYVERVLDFDKIEMAAYQLTMPGIAGKEKEKEDERETGSNGPEAA